MIRQLFKCFLAFNSIMFLLIVFLVKEALWIPGLYMWSIAIYLVAPVVLSAICLAISNAMSKDSIAGGIVSVELANEAYLPSYIGYFFVALSIPNLPVLWVVFGILFVFLFSSQTLYYNPLFLLFGYKYYLLITSSGAKILVITKEKLRIPGEISFSNLRRINDFTFIDRGEK